MSGPDDLEEPPLPGAQEPPEEAEFDAKLQAASPGAGLRALVGLAVIWGALYLVALANQISDNRKHPAPAQSFPAVRGPGEGSRETAPDAPSKESGPSAQSRKASERVLCIAGVGAGRTRRPSSATSHAPPRSIRS